MVVLIIIQFEDTTISLTRVSSLVSGWRVHISSLILKFTCYTFYKKHLHLCKMRC
jgi:hypothetical protein